MATTCQSAAWGRASCPGVPTSPRLSGLACSQKVRGSNPLRSTTCRSEAPVTPRLPTAAGAFARLDRAGD
jgi:hypothetical protein